MTTRAEIVEMQREAAAVLREIEQTDARLEQEAERERQERLVEATETVARNTSPRLLRSTMSVGDKHQYIQRHGQDRYLDLPWA